MKTMKFLLTGLAIAVLAVSCKPENTKEDVRVLQAANVRMEIKNQQKPTKTAIVGDSAAVKKLARWAYAMFAVCNEREENPIFHGVVGMHDISIDNDWFCRRDTNACVFSYSFTTVFSYRAYDMDTYAGIPGTEVPGVLMVEDNFVFVGYYDTIKHRYKDPFILRRELSNPDEDWFHINSRIDTMGYIPQSQIEANYPRLKKLFDEGKYSAMEEIMRTGYTIYTCTGAEYRELVKQGRN